MEIEIFVLKAASLFLKSLEFRTWGSKLVIQQMAYYGGGKV
jgi:hypothetical protein